MVRTDLDVFEWCQELSIVKVIAFWHGESFLWCGIILGDRIKFVCFSNNNDT